MIEYADVGFETRTWASANTPIGQNINVFKTDSLNAGQKQDVWYLTTVDPKCFKKKTWNQLRVNDFYYVISLAPEKIRIKME